MIKQITAAYIRNYSDNQTTVAYVEWIDTKGVKGRTEGDPNGLHMTALLNRAVRENVQIERQQW